MQAFFVGEKHPVENVFSPNVTAKSHVSLQNVKQRFTKRKTRNFGGRRATFTFVMRVRIEVEMGDILFPEIGRLLFR